MKNHSLIYSVVARDQTSQFYTRDPLVALGAAQARVTCHPAIYTRGATRLVLPSGKHIKVEVMEK